MYYSFHPPRTQHIHPHTQESGGESSSPQEEQSTATAAASTITAGGSSSSSAGRPFASSSASQQSSSGAAAASSLSQPPMASRYEEDDEEEDDKDDGEYGLMPTVFGAFASHMSTGSGYRVNSNEATRLARLVSSCPVPSYIEDERKEYTALHCTAVLISTSFFLLLSRTLAHDTNTHTDGWDGSPNPRIQSDGTS